MKDFQSTPELLEYINKAYEMNNWEYSKNEILNQLRERWYLFKWQKLSDVLLQNTDWQDKLIAAISKPDNEIDFNNEEWEKALSFGDEEEIELKTKDNSNNYERLNDYVRRYNELVKNKEKIINDYNWWKWYSKDSKKHIEYNKLLEDVNKQLQDMENSDELKEITQSIIDNWLWDRWYQSNEYARAWLANIIDKVGSSFWADDTNILWQSPLWKTTTNMKNIKDLSKKYLEQSWLDTKQLNPEFVEKNKDNEKLNPEFRKKLQEQYDKQQWNKDKKMQSGIWDKEVTDNMKFWNDVTSKDYLDRRNNTLVMHLQQNWITDREAINKYLEQYDSWKNAKKEWKDNTLNNLTSLIDKNNKNKETKKKEQEKNKEKQKKNDNKDKKDDTLMYDKNWNAVWSKWTPSNDDSINWVDDEYIYDENWNKVWSKDKTEKKENNKKDVDINRLLPNSAVIKWLLNIKKSK